MRLVKLSLVLAFVFVGFLSRSVCADTVKCPEATHFVRLDLRNQPHCHHCEPGLFQVGLYTFSE